MDCTNARMLLHFVRTGELDPAERDVVANHLTACPECAVLAESENRIDDALESAMLRVAVPAGLKGRILQQLTRARPRRWPWVAAAAVLLLGLVGGYVALTIGPEELNSWDFVRRVDIKATPEDVEAWFASEMGAEVIAPREFNFDLLENIDIAEVQGRKVAKLTFLHRGGGAVAHVYVLSTSQFKLPAQQEEKAAQNSSWLPEISIPAATHDIQIRRYPSVPGFFYVVIFNRGSLDQFLVQGI